VVADVTGSEVDDAFRRTAEFVFSAGQRRDESFSLRAAAIRRPAARELTARHSPARPTIAELYC